MTFPQPDSNEAALSFSTFFRLKTQLQSPGDLFESEQGSHAIALGPDSDLASVVVYYYDELTRYFIPVGGALPQLDTSKMSSALITPDRPLMGLVNARIDQPYPLIDRPGRILFAAGDIVDPTYLPAGFDPTEDALFYEPIYIDIIQYFTPEPGIIPQRSDKTYRYQYLASQLQAGGSSFVVIPGYGRKSGAFNFLNLGAPITVNVYGARLSTSNLPGPVGASEIQLATMAIASAGTAKYAYKSSTDGLWDVFYIEYVDYAASIANPSVGDPFPTVVTLSDDAL